MAGSHLPHLRHWAAIPCFKLTVARAILSAPTDLIEVVQQLGRILIDSCRTGTLQLLLPIAA
jgi:hypothetical protein